MNTQIYSRGALEEMSKKDIAEIGKMFGAEGTKLEMIETILSKQVPIRMDETQDLIDAINRSLGDFNKTYALRERVLTALHKLKGYEAKEVKQW